MEDNVSDNNIAVEAPMRESNPILASIQEWAEENAPKVEQAYYLSGGWEVWAQVELAIALTQQHGFRYGPGEEQIITREDWVYGRKKSDIMFEFSGGSNIIELKCESSKNSKNFVSDVLEDLDKVKTNQIASKYWPTTVWVIGIGISDVGEKLNEIPELKKFVPIKGNHECPVKIWWWTKTFKHES